MGGAPVKLSELIRAMGRRWYVVLAGLLVVTGLAYLTLRFIPLTYDVKSSVLLLPPTSTLEEGGNPFLNLGGLDVAAGVLAKSLTDSETTDTVVPTGSKAKYTVEKDASVSGSVLEVAVSDTSASGAFRTLNAILTLADTRMADLQVSAKALPKSEIRLMVITNNTVAEPNYSALARTLIVVIAVGLVFTLLLAISVDALVRRRAIRKQRATPRTTRRSRRTSAATPDPADVGTTVPEDDSVDAGTIVAEHDSVEGGAKVPEYASLEDSTDLDDPGPRHPTRDEPDPTGADADYIVLAALGPDDTPGGPGADTQPIPSTLVSENT